MTNAIKKYASLPEKWTRGKCRLYYDALVLYDVFVVTQHKIRVSIAPSNHGILILNVYTVNIIARRRMLLIVRKACTLDVLLFYIIVNSHFDNS